MYECSAAGAAVHSGLPGADLSAIYANFGLMEKLLAKWKNPIWPLPKVAESGLIESISAE
jgi:hypothetical protein